MDERRNAPRRRVLKAGMIITHEKFSTINCVVRNVSEFGARIEVEAAVLIPGQFELLFDGKSCVCEVAWKSQRHFGLRFV
jgi:PilZ domain-containing protein